MAESPELVAAPATPKPSSPPPRSGIPPRYDLDAKWDLSIRRVACASLAGAFVGHTLLRSSPTTRWESAALGAGLGIGAAYADCSYIFNDSPPRRSPKVSTVTSAHSERREKI
ncbi:unnamed protein product [Alopecurus aequalis]